MVTVWQIIAAIAAAPSSAVVVRAISRRLSERWKARTSEVDYLRTEIIRMRAECADARVVLLAEIEGLERGAEALRAEVAALQKEETRLRQMAKVAMTENDMAMAFLGALTSRDE